MEYSRASSLYSRTCADNRNVSVFRRVLDVRISRDIRTFLRFVLSKGENNKHILHLDNDSFLQSAVI